MNILVFVGKLPMIYLNVYSNINNKLDAFCKLEYTMMWIQNDKFCNKAHLLSTTIKWMRFCREFILTLNYSTGKKLGPRQCQSLYFTIAETWKCNIHRLLLFFTNSHKSIRKYYKNEKRIKIKRGTTNEELKVMP